MKLQFRKHIALCLIVIAFASCHQQSDILSSNAIQKNDHNTSVKSIYQRLSESSELSISETLELYQQLKADSLSHYNFDNEQELNRLGYDYLFAEDTKSAIEIFEFLVSEFPNSSNPYDSLGEAYMKDENEELALLNYQKTLEMNPDNNHAIDQVTILTGKELLITDWGKEFFHFPLHFAEEIPYQGVEEVVFPKGWIHPDSSDFWSYVFVWSLDNKKSVSSQELESNLKLYFDGLMEGSSRTDQSKLTKTTAQFEKNVNPEDSVTYIGQLHIFDGFATQAPLELNARIYSNYCAQSDQLTLLFRFSPQEYRHEVWDLLRTVKLWEGICE